MVNSRCVRVVLRKIWKKLIWLAENETVLILAMAFFLCSPTMEVITSNNKTKHFSVIMGIVLHFVLVPLVIGQNVIHNIIPLHL